MKRHRGRSGYHDEVFHDDDHVIRILTKILDDASGSHRKLDPSEGLQDAQLDNGARLHIVHGDISRGGHVMVNVRKFTGVAFRHLDQLVERDMLSPAAAAFLAECVRARQTIVDRRRAGLGQDHAAVLLRGGARSRAPRRGRRGGVRGRRPVAERREHADTSGPSRPTRRRPAQAGGRVPAHGAGRRDRRRGARPRGAAAPAHALVGGEGVHHHPRRLGAAGAHAPAVHLPALGVRQRAPAQRAQHPRQREHRRRRALRRGRRRSARHGDRRGRGPGIRRRRRPVHRHTGVRPSRATGRWPGRATSRCASATRSTDRGRSIHQLLGADAAETPRGGRP